MAKHHILKRVALAPQRGPAFLVCCKPLSLGLQHLGSSRRTLWWPQPTAWGDGHSHLALSQAASLLWWLVQFSTALKLLITELGSSTRAFHSCSPCGLMQHAFLEEQMVYHVESYCIFVSPVCIYLCRSSSSSFFIRYAYRPSAELGISTGFVLDIFNFIFVYECSILHWVGCALWSFREQNFTIWIEISSKTARGKKHFPLRSKKIFKRKYQYFLKQALYSLKYHLVFKSVDVFSVSNLWVFLIDIIWSIWVKMLFP